MRQHLIQLQQRREKANSAHGISRKDMQSGVCVAMINAKRGRSMQSS